MGLGAPGCSVTEEVSSVALAIVVASVASRLKVASASLSTNNANPFVILLGEKMATIAQNAILLHTGTIERSWCDVLPVDECQNR